MLLYERDDHELQASDERRGGRWYVRAHSWYGRHFEPMDEIEIDDTIESSFPASDPPGWTPSRAGPAPAARRDVLDGDIESLFLEFYSVATVDPLLGSYFTGIDMRRHMPRIVDFWSTMLFHTGRYSGSAFEPHTRMPGLTGDHFLRWVNILESTVDARFAGPNAQVLKGLARRIAYGMQVRLGIAPQFPFVTPE
jgi:hemoglobin